MYWQLIRVDNDDVKRETEIKKIEQFCRTFLKIGDKGVPSKYVISF